MTCVSRPFAAPEIEAIAFVAISMLPFDSDAGYFSAASNEWVDDCVKQVSDGDSCLLGH